MHSPNPIRSVFSRRFAVTGVFLVIAGSFIALSSPRTEIAQDSSEAAHGTKDLDQAAVFDAILRHALTDTKLASSRAFYGSPIVRRFALVTNPTDGVRWPRDYTPNIDGWEVFRVNGEEAPLWDEPPTLGIRLEEFTLEYPGDSGVEKVPFEDLSRDEQIDYLVAEIELVASGGPIQITMTNVGGPREHNEFVIGGSRISYRELRGPTGWTIEYLGWSD